MNHLNEGMVEAVNSSMNGVVFGVGALVLMGLVILLFMAIPYYRQVKATQSKSNTSRRKG